jgi:predicted Zn-dependent protease
METASLAASFREAIPSGCDGAWLRVVDEREEFLTVRRGVVDPPRSTRDVGAMVTVWADGGAGYAATADLTTAGLRAALEDALAWARSTKGRLAYTLADVPRPVLGHAYESPVAQPWQAVPFAERLDRVRSAAASMAFDDRIVRHTASLFAVDVDVLLVDADGGTSFQQLRHLTPELEAVAHSDGLTQRRTLGGLRGASQQGGAEILERFGFGTEGRRVASQALELLAAPPCPTGTMELVLAPDQMMLQIHESIGHPLELDRILGDERNYAGTSFVTPDMFRTYQYGSELLDVTFDPTLTQQYASYGFDDDGTAAERAYIIRKGKLERPLGGALSQARAGLPGVANSRASAWHRPPIDRMANLNVEAGDATFDEVLSGIELGVYMETNRSWSIDDSRNKFQFGCEYGRVIRDGQLAEVVRDPGYRGVSASFWRSLSAVGNPDTVSVLGTPYCGKGEPNQVVRVGHASPVCRFSDIAVFGGA